MHNAFVSVGTDVTNPSPSISCPGTWVGVRYFFVRDVGDAESVAQATDLESWCQVPGLLVIFGTVFSCFYGTVIMGRVGGADSTNPVIWPSAAFMVCPVGAHQVHPPEIFFLANIAVAMVTASTPSPRT